METKGMLQELEEWEFPDITISASMVRELDLSKLIQKPRKHQGQHVKDGLPKPWPSTSEIINRFLAYKRAAGLAEASLANYKDMLNAFARQHPVLPGSPEPIEEFLTSKRGLTRGNYYSVLSALYKFANERLGMPNPMEKIPKPRFKPKEPSYLTKVQARALLDAIQDDRERAWVYLFLGQGLRLSEALRLNVEDIGDSYIVISGKNRIERMPLLPEVRDILLKLADGRSDKEPVFLGQRGRLGRDMVEKDIKELFKRVGINGVKQSPHTLRHTFGTLATIAGCDTYSLARLMRHQFSPRTNMTAHYIHLNLDELGEKLERYSPLRLLNAAGQGLGKNI